jgi:hypothetical protein
MFNRFIRPSKLGERNYQGLANRIILPESGPLERTGSVRKRQRLGGMLNYYYRGGGINKVRQRFLNTTQLIS